MFLSAASFAAPLLAASRAWPDAIDLTMTVMLLGSVLAMSFAGYVLCALDVRAWIRSLRRVLVVVVDRGPRFVSWFAETPHCLRTFGLKLPCTEEELRRAYRQLAKTLHPDRGGDLRRFKRLQEDFEESLGEIRRYRGDRSSLEPLV
jgi:hypothetical protein